MCSNRFLMVLDYGLDCLRGKKKENFNKWELLLKIYNKFNVNKNKNTEKKKTFSIFFISSTINNTRVVILNLFHLTRK
ncbi:hypothetical protein WN943_021431 [Citrus x changshan-huyou]